MLYGNGTLIIYGPKDALVELEEMECDTDFTFNEIEEFTDFEGPEYFANVTLSDSEELNSSGKIKRHLKKLAQQFPECGFDFEGTLEDEDGEYDDKLHLSFNSKIFEEPVSALETDETEDEDDDETEEF